MNGSGWRFWLGGVLLAAALSAQAQDVSEEARRHMVRGATALQMAKSADELHYAIKEFQEAVRLAPNWAVAWFNLGTVQEKAGNIPGAIAAFKRYLELAPTAEDAPKVGDKLIALEYMQERAAQMANLAGTWGNHEVTVEGNKFVAVGTTEHSWMMSVYFSGDTEQGPRYPSALPDRFEGIIQGDTIQGTVTRQAFLEERSECTIPEDRAEFTAKVNEDGTKISFKHERAHYRVDWDGIFWGLSGCTSVTRDGSTPVAFEWTRTKPAVTPAAEKKSQPDDLVAPKRGIVGLRVKVDENGGGLQVQEVVAGRAAERAGIRGGDRLVAIDGKEVRNASMQDAVTLLRGDAGTSVKVTILREGGTPVEYTLVREAFEMLE